MPNSNIFISYSHDSLLHTNHVLEFANRLVSTGIRVILDQYEFAPVINWQRWTERNISKADYVLMVCTEPYFRNVMGEEKSITGLGVKWEGNLIYQHLYTISSARSRFIPVLFDYSSVEHIPTPLQGTPYYRVETSDGFDGLYRHITTNQTYLNNNLQGANYFKRLSERRVTVIIEISGNDIDSFDQSSFRHGIADYLKIPAFEIHIVNIEKGSIKLTVEIPDEYVDKLIGGFVSKDRDLLERLLPIILLSARLAENTSQEQVNDHQVDFLIITALEKEAKAVVKLLDNHEVKRPEKRDIRTYHLGTIPVANTNWVYQAVVVLLPDMGQIPAATAVTDAITFWNPRFVFMVGIAGGIPQDDLDLGDVVIANQIIGYDYGKVTDKIVKPRDRVYPSSALLLDRIRSFWDDQWTQYVYTPRPQNSSRSIPKRFVGPIASGNKVIASTEFRNQLLSRWSKLVAVETEAEGVFAAVFDRPNIRGTLVIRGICDMADERKGDEWQEYAADAAATFLIHFLKSGPVEQTVIANNA